MVVLSWKRRGPISIYFVGCIIPVDHITDSKAQRWESQSWHWSWVWLSIRWPAMWDLLDWCGNSPAGNWWVTEGLELSHQWRCHGGWHVPVAPVWSDNGVQRHRWTLQTYGMKLQQRQAHGVARCWVLTENPRWPHWSRQRRSLGAFFHHQRWVFSPPPDHQSDKTDHWSQITSMTHELPLGELLSPLSGAPFRDGSDLLKINVMINQTMMLHNWSDFSRSVLLIMWYGKPNSIEALNHLRVYPVCLGWCLLCPVMGEQLMSFGIVFTTVLIAHPSEWSYGPSRKDFFCPNLQIMNTCASTSWYCIYGVFMGFGWFWHLLIWIWQWNSEEL